MATPRLTCFSFGLSKIFQMRYDLARVGAGVRVRVRALG